MSHLPDKGEKLQLLVRRLDIAISNAADIDKATELMRMMSINNADSEEIQEQLRGVLNTACTQKIYSMAEDGVSRQNDNECDMNKGEIFIHNIILTT